jgi:mRNA-degrading endonuclease YafQ of YafQ-DinJ toxin-antitoxin module
LTISQTKIFGKQKKKLYPNQISALDKVVREIVANPTVGDLKKGDLQGIRVFKFRMLNQEYLLAYIASEDQISLLAIGTHENFYRDLKKTL